MKQPFRILAVGDAVGDGAVEFLSKRLRRLRTGLKADLVVVNGENASPGNGMTKSCAEALLAAGADVLTSGNHIWQKKEMLSYLDENPLVLRPANYPPACPGQGEVIVEAGGLRVLCMNLMGTVYLDPLDCPFRTADRILERNRGKYDLSVLDLHAEATSEKRAMGYYLDGRVSVVWGTHTHVQTNDAQILPGGTGYITDLGMTGPRDSVLGMKKEIIIERFLTHLPARFEQETQGIELHGAYFEVDRESGRTTKAETVSLS